ncbi:unnamed protein product [Brassica rapa subsp. narinosa]
MAFIEETAPPVRQDSPGKRQRAALLKNRFADTIMKAREKTLTKGENGDPEKLRIEREKFERRLREGWFVVHRMEKTVEINEGRRFMEDLEILRATGAEADQLPTFMKEMSPKFSKDMLGSFKMEGNSNPLEQLGLYMKMDEDEEDEPHFSQGEVDEQPFDRKERLTLSPHVAEKEDQLDSGNEKPVSEKGQENGNQEDEKPINQKEGEEQIENVPVNPHGEEGLVNRSEGGEEVVSEQAQDNGNQEDENLINQNEGKEQLENVPEQENGVEDKTDEEAEVVEKGDEETDVDKGDDDAEVMDEETQVVDIGEEEAEVFDVDMVKVETEVVHNGERKKLKLSTWESKNTNLVTGDKKLKLSKRKRKKLKL